ncbi:MAG: thiolase family protein [Candidatus Atabeyarchaeum deiterrae]
MVKPRVAIVGVGQTKCESKKKDVFYDIVYEAASKALQDAGMERSELDTVIEAGDDVADGRTISNMHTCTSAGGFLKDESRCAEDGTFSLAYAYMRLASGLHDTAMVTGIGTTESPFELVTNYAFDHLFTRGFGLSWVTSFAMHANGYMKAAGVTEKQAAKVVVKNRRNGAKNPYAHLRKAVTLNEALRSPMVSYPLKKLDLPPSSSGACAVVLASSEYVKRITDKPVWIDGLAWNVGSYYFQDAEPGELLPLRWASERAYKMAGIENPLRDLQVAELHDITSYHELMEYEALKLCDKGCGGATIDKMDSDGRIGELAVNPSGGALSSHPHHAAGLFRVAEAALQLRGEAGKHQVKGVKKALAHGITHIAGAASMGHGVVILSKD